MNIKLWIQGALSIRNFKKPFRLHMGPLGIISCISLLSWTDIHLDRWSWVVYEVQCNWKMNYFFLGLLIFKRECRMCFYFNSIHHLIFKLQIFYDKMCVFYSFPIHRMSNEQMQNNCSNLTSMYDSYIKQVYLEICGWFLFWGLDIIWWAWDLNQERNVIHQCHLSI